MILSKPEILKAVKKGDLAVTPFDKKNVGCCSVDLTLSNEFLLFEGKGHHPLLVHENTYASEEFKKHTKKVVLKGGNGILLAPGELVLGQTKERVRLTQNLCAKIEGRSRFARIGLMVHVSSSFVQPGVNNKQVLEIVNFSPFKLVLEPGTKICQLVFGQVKGKAKYGGVFREQDGF
ncbi:MAG: dCTP deaminase [Candidatus Micrarchaeia archaeon]